jgi:hypothetical protein
VPPHPFDVATKTDNAITFNCVFILLPLYYYIIFKTYTNYSSDEMSMSSLSAANGAALEAAMAALRDTAGFKSRIGLAGTTLTGTIIILKCRRFNFHIPSTNT